MIAEAVTGSAQSLNLDAGRDGENYVFVLRTLDGVATGLNGTVNFSALLPTIDMQFAEEPGGPVGALLKLPQESGMEASLHFTQGENGAFDLHDSYVNAASLHMQASGSLAPDDEIRNGMLVFNVCRTWRC